MTKSLCFQTYDKLRTFKKLKMNFKLFFLCLLTSLLNCKVQNIPLYIGTYTNGDSKGIYQAEFNVETGALSNFKLAAKSTNPSYITFSPNKQFLYAVGEGGDGSVSSFKVQGNGLLQFLNTVPSNGAAPCHISIKSTGDIAVVSNYNGGTISLYNISANGSLNPAYQIFDYNSAPDKVSHAHSAQFFNNQLFVSDLGMDAIYQYTLDSDGKTYELTSSAAVPISEKAGPRHFALTNDGNFMYTINEYASTITASKRGLNQFELITDYSTLDANYKGPNSCADIHLSKDENYIYGSNRGENTIVVFKRNLDDGSLAKIQSIAVEGDWPRNFTLDPTGKFLLVANKKSNNISVFKVDSNTGKLSFLHSAKAASPVCLLF